MEIGFTLVEDELREFKIKYINLKLNILNKLIWQMTKLREFKIKYMFNILYNYVNIVQYGIESYCLCK